MSESTFPFRLFHPRFLPSFLVPRFFLVRPRPSRSPVELFLSMLVISLAFGYSTFHVPSPLSVPQCLGFSLSQFDYSVSFLVFRPRTPCFFHDFIFFVRVFLCLVHYHVTTMMNDPQKNFLYFLGCACEWYELHMGVQFRMWSWCVHCLDIVCNGNITSLPSYPSS
ncbi:hypothetical protein K439DRAFT_956728 [Ramaria rubella]|nr:hypothetical protein K439DRAFT_956728 [Ramaria rubella]